MENWKIGDHSSTVVSDTVVKNTNFPVPPNPEDSSRSDIEYYGGHLICESIGNRQHAHLISAAPDMLEVLKSLENDDNSIPDAIWEMRNKAIAKAEGK